MSVGPIGVMPPGELEAALNSDQPAPAPPTYRVSPLDKHAHLRRVVEDLYADQQRSEEALRVHQAVLQKHADLHRVQATAREDLRRMLEARLKAVEHHVDIVDKRLLALASEADALANSGFLGRLRWLLTGK